MLTHDNCLRAPDICCMTVLQALLMTSVRASRDAGQQPCCSASDNSLHSQHDLVPTRGEKGSFVWGSVMVVRLLHADNGRSVPFAEDPTGEHSVPDAGYRRHHRPSVLQRRHQLAHDPALPRHDCSHLKSYGVVVRSGARMVDHRRPACKMLSDRFAGLRRSSPRPAY